MRKLEHDKTGDSAEWREHPHTRRLAMRLRAHLEVSKQALINRAAKSTEPELQRLHEEYLNLQEMLRIFTGRNDVQDNE